VADAVATVEVEPLFPDGHRLVVLHDPIRAVEPPPARIVAPRWLDGATGELTLRNAGEVPVGITSHFHLFEVNRALDFPRAGAWGMRLAVAPGVKVVVAAGEERTVRMVPIAGARVVRGHGGLVDGPLDAPGALEAALQRARERGYRGA
jgi:urease subunit gamma/beta